MIDFLAEKHYCYAGALQTTLLKNASVIFISTFLLATIKELPLHQILFETTSAIGTIGLSTGITGGLSIWGKGVIIFVMFAGRLELLTFGLAIMARRNKIATKTEEADLAV